MPKGESVVCAAFMVKRGQTGVRRAGGKEEMACEAVQYNKKGENRRGSPPYPIGLRKRQAFWSGTGWRLQASTRPGEG
jgi:hypothetical protein